MDIMGLFKELIILKHAVAVCALYAFYRLLRTLPQDILSGENDDIINAVKKLRIATEKQHEIKIGEDSSKNPIIKTVPSSMDPEQALNMVVKYRTMTTGILLISAVIFLIIAAIVTLK